MTVLQEAIQAAEERKKAAGLDVDAESLQFSHGELQEMAIFSGFDMDHDELLETARRVGWFFVQQTPQTGTLPLFTACWTDGLLIGLMLANKLAPHHTAAGGSDAPGGQPGDSQ